MTALQTEIDLGDISTINEISHRDEIETIITKLQIETSNYQDDSASLCLSYTPPFDQYAAQWDCFIVVGSRWSNRIIAQKYNPSLYQACSELLDEFQNIQ